MSKSISTVIVLIALFVGLCPATAQTAESYFQQALTELNRSGNQQVAVDLYTKSIAVSPTFGKAYGYRAYAYYKLLDGPNAIKDASTAISLGFDASFVRLALGAGFYWSERYKDAIREFDKAVALDANEFGAYGMRSLAKMSAGLLDGALADANLAVTLSPSNADVYDCRAGVLEIVGDRAQLQSDYRTVLKLSGESDSTTKVIALAGLGENQQALELCNRILANGTNSTVSMQKGRALLQMGRYAEALPCIQVYLDGSPRFARGQLYKGLCLLGMHRNQEAQICFETAVAALPTYADAQLQLARCLLEQKKYDQALVHANIAIDLPLNAAALQMKDKILQQKIQEQKQLSSGASAGADTVASGDRPVDDKWAVIIGISQFKDPKINLKCPSRDAADFSNYLVTKAGFAKDHVMLLVDSQATREAILSTIGDKWLPRLAHPNDLVVIYVSTHGSPSEADIGSVNYLVAHDTAVDSLYATGIPLQDLIRIIKKRVQSNRVVLILDACHSGAAEAETKGLHRANNVDAESIAQGTGQLVLSSSSQDQQAWESKDGPNSVFTRRLLEGLQVAGPATNINQCFDYVKDKVYGDVLRERGRLQTPVMKSQWNGSGCILSAPPVKPRPGLP